jgi:EF hand
MRVPVAALASIFLASTAPAHAVSFPQADRNSDGVVSFDEAERAFSDLNIVFIEKADRNGDGAIDRSEIPYLNSYSRFQKHR